MNTIDFIRHSMTSSHGWAMGLLMDMKENAMVQPTAVGGNHPLWILGHMVHSESNLFDIFVLGQPNRFPELESICGMRSQPTTDASVYPTFDELLAKFAEIRAAALAHLDTLSDGDLDQPSHAPAEMSDFFGTVGACYAAMSTHVAFHGGQVAVCRKSLGRDPVMA